MHKTLELRGQHQVDDRQCEQDRDVDLAAAALEVRRLAVVHQCCAGRQFAAHRAFEPVERRAERVSGRETGAHRD